MEFKGVAWCGIWGLGLHASGAKVFGVQGLVAPQSTRLLRVSISSSNLLVHCKVSV